MKAMTIRRAVPLAFALLAACGGASAGPDRPSPQPQRHDPNVITEEDLRGSASGSLYDAIRRLRPGWRLQGPPTTLLRQSDGGVIVYVDGIRFGGVETLRQFQPSSVLSIRYYSPGEAEGQFGPGHLKGAIAIVTRH